MVIIMIMVMLMLMTWRRRKEDDVCIFPRVAVGEDALFGILDVCSVSTSTFICVFESEVRLLVARRWYHTLYIINVSPILTCVCK